MRTEGVSPEMLAAVRDSHAGLVASAIQTSIPTSPSSSAISTVDVSGLGSHSQLQNPRTSILARLCATILAVTATGTSAAIAIVAGWDRGGEVTERLAWTFVGLVLLLSAHLIPALCRILPKTAKIAAMAIWLCSMVATGYGHATFFVMAQQHAGETRAEAVKDAPATEQVKSFGFRGLTEIASDRARTEQNLARLQAQTCRDYCSALQVRKSSLESRLSALNVEFQESQRRERAIDAAAADHARVVARRESLAADPVTRLVAGMLGVTVGTVNLIVALSFGWLLESVGCLAWLLALPRPMACVAGGSRASRATESRLTTCSSASSDPVTTTGVTSVASFAGPAVDEVTLEAGSDPKEVGDDTAQLQTNSGEAITDEQKKKLDLALVTAAVADGRIRPTVDDIRRFRRCGQSYAVELRREYKSQMQPATTESQSTEERRAPPVLAWSRSSEIDRSKTRDAAVA
ncbi:hypothetical protein [Paraburkholderia sp. SIMBA_054]|uniref:hypothetical protein n=1 Tax=Paraburkholderia sp. SIMBA_054 TaxID=3085795 RepID=UPI0039799893